MNVNSREFIHSLIFNIAGFEDKLFIDYLRSKKLTDNLIHYVLYAIAMCTEDTPCMEGVARTQRFLSSLGRYGNTPFLWPMYGSGELPQCFCRLCAVFGGLYHLKRAAQHLLLAPDGSCKGISSGGRRLEAGSVVMGVGYAPERSVVYNFCFQLTQLKYLKPSPYL